MKVYVSTGQLAYDKDFDTGSSLKYFTTLNAGSFFNFTGFIMKKESLFDFKCSGKCIIMELPRKAFKDLSNKNDLLQNIETTVKALFEKED